MYELYLLSLQKHHRDNEKVTPVLSVISCTHSTFFTKEGLEINMNVPGWLIPVDEVLEEEKNSFFLFLMKYIYLNDVIEVKHVPKGVKIGTV